MRLNEDPFWVNAAWGIDYETKQISGDGRAEVWEDFCNAAKTCELTRQRTRLTQGFKAAAARVLQACWMRVTPDAVRCSKMSP